MENDLVMDVSGSWIRRAKKSSAAQLNQLSDVAEKIFLTRHQRNATPTCVNNPLIEDLIHVGKFKKKRRQIKNHDLK